MSLKFWKFRLGPCLLPQPASLLCFPPPVPCAARPPRWDAPGQIQLRLRFTWRPHELLDPAPRALELPPFATPPPKLRAAATSPPPWPEPAAAPRTPNSRALRNPEHRSLLFPSFFWPLAAPEAQNRAAALRFISGEAPPWRHHLPPPVPQAEPFNRTLIIPRSSQAGLIDWKTAGAPSPEFHPSPPLLFASSSPLHRSSSSPEPRHSLASTQGTSPASPSPFLGTGTPSSLVPSSAAATVTPTSHHRPSLLQPKPPTGSSRRRGSSPPLSPKLR